MYRPALFYFLSAISLLLTACAAPDDNPFPYREVRDQPQDESGTGLRTGIFVDSRVAGLRYSRPDQAGLSQTGQYGTFFYAPGEPVRFYLGNIYLGTAVGSPILTPNELMDNNRPLTTAEVNRRLRLFQTLDQNNDPGDGIGFEPAVMTAANESSFAEDILASDAGLDMMLSQLNSLKAFGGDVTAQQARAHFTESQRKLLVGNYVLRYQVRRTGDNPDLLQMEFGVDNSGRIQGWTETLLTDNEVGQEYYLAAVSGQIDETGAGIIAVENQPYSLTIQISNQGAINGRVGMGEEDGALGPSNIYGQLYYQSTDAAWTLLSPNVADINANRLAVYNRSEQLLYENIIAHSTANAMWIAEGTVGAPANPSDPDSAPSALVQMDILRDASITIGATAGNDSGAEPERFVLEKQPYEYGGVYQYAGWTFTVQSNGLMSAIRDRDGLYLGSGRVRGNGQFEVKIEGYYSSTECGSVNRLTGEIHVFLGVRTLDAHSAPSCI